jgi:dUTP pyrophosphatase
MKILFKKLDFFAKIPTRKLDTDAGLDFYSLEEKTIWPNDYVIISTGIAWEPQNIPESTNVYMEIKSRSGLAFKHSVEASNAGVIDQEYRGEIKIKLYNNSGRSYTVKKGDRVAQGIIKLLPRYSIEETDSLNSTERNDKGFGSSGK